MSAGKPWELDPVLKPNRLLLLAKIAASTRNQAYLEANRDLGDTNWGIGCKAHERFVHAIAKLAATTERSWLRVHRDGLSFTSIVEGVAVRAYRGPADKPHHRHVQAAQLEMERVQRRQLALFDEAIVADEPWAWLMAVETDDAGRALRVVFFQANDAGETRNAWIAPLEIAPVEAAPFEASATNATSVASSDTGASVLVVRPRAKRTRRNAHIANGAEPQPIAP